MWCEREWNRYTPVLALRVAFQFALDHVDHNLVANQTTLIHDLLGLPSEVGLLRDLGPQHVTSGLGKESHQPRESVTGIPNVDSLLGGRRSTSP